MADSTVGALTAASTLTGTELFYGVQSANDVKITASQIATFTGGGGGGSMAIGGAITSATLGSVLFAGTGGVLAQNNANFFWDDANKTLKVGTTSSLGSYYLNGVPALFEVPSVGGSSNWFEGNAGNKTLSGSGNFGTGDGVLASLTTGIGNVAIGGASTFLGSATAAAMTTSGTAGKFGNLAIGSSALSGMTTGENNVAMGANAMLRSLDSDDCVAIGTNAMSSLDQFGGRSVTNIAMGTATFQHLASGSQSTAIGSYSGQNATNSTNNTYLGFSCGLAMTSGDTNTFVGSQAGFAVGSGNNNVYLGAAAGGSLTGTCSNNTIVGGWAGPSASVSNVVALTDGAYTSVPLIDYNYTNPNIWSFHRTSVAQGTHLYNVFDNVVPTVNYERAVFDWNVTSNVLTIGTQAGGTGVVRPIKWAGLPSKSAPIGTDQLLLLDSGSSNAMKTISAFAFSGGAITNPYVPTDLGTALRAWYAMDTLSGSAGSSQGSIADGSGNGFGLSQTGTNRGTLAVADQNGLNTLRLTAANSQNYTLANSILSGAAAGSMYLVIKTTSATGGFGLVEWGTSAAGDWWPYVDGNLYVSFGSTTRRNAVPTTSISAGYIIVSITTAAGAWQLYVDGGTGGSSGGTSPLITSGTNTVGFNASPIFLGYSPITTSYMNGWIAELYVTNAAQSTAERQKNEGYLAWKWGLAGNLSSSHPYKTAIPTSGGGASFAAISKAGSPAAGDLPAGSFALIDDTSANQTWLVFNKAGTIRKVQLT